MADEDPATGIGDHQIAVGLQLGRPTLAVQSVVVATAQQHAVRRTGEPTVFHMDQVVGIRPAGRAVTAGEAAVAVAHHQGVEQLAEMVLVAVP